MINAVIISEFSVVSGLVASFYLNFASGGTIVLTAALVFVAGFVYKQIIVERLGKKASMQIEGSHLRN
jgi:zinc transport system permease protein